MGLINSPCKNCANQDMNKERCLPKCKKIKEIQLKLSVEANEMIVEQDSFPGIIYAPSKH